MEVKEIQQLYQNPKFGLLGKNAFIQKFDLQKEKDKVYDYLHSTDTYTLNYPVIHKFTKLKTISVCIDYQWQSDLVDMQLYANENDGYKYLLTCIDITSRYAWVKPLKDKTAASVVEGFQKIIEKKRKPKLLQTDNGTEFLSDKFQNFCKKENIIHFVPPSNSNASMVERFHRTLKMRMSRLWSLNNNYRYIDDLQDLVFNYNHSYHRVIKMCPYQVDKENQSIAIHNSNKIKETNEKQKFKVGDYVRIARLRRTFNRETDDKFSEKIFKIKEIRNTIPKTYKLEDIDGKKDYNDIFYGPELVKYTGDINDKEYKIEKILDVRKKGRGKEVLVKWLSYDEETWEPYSNLKHIKGIDEIIKKIEEEN